MENLSHSASFQSKEKIAPSKPGIKQFDGQPDLDPERLVFIDETWTSTNMARKCGRAPKGERLRAAIPHGHWKTTTFVAALRLSGVAAPMVLDGPINGRWFQAYVDQVLVDERDVSRLARDWWAAYAAKVEAEREEWADRRGMVSAENQLALRIAKRRGTSSKAVRGREKVGA